MAETAKWYVVHTYSGYENTVKATIEKTVESRGLHDQILAISIPLETVTEITETGATKTYDRKVYPGYVLVKMIYSDDTWHIIRNIRGTAGFVGASGNSPLPLSDEEVYGLAVHYYDEDDLKVDLDPNIKADVVTEEPTVKIEKVSSKKSKNRKKNRNEPNDEQLSLFDMLG